MNQEEIKQDQIEQKLIAEGTRAEELLASENYILIKNFTKLGSDKIKDVIAKGISNDIDENGNITRTWQEKYWEYVGKNQALNSIESYLNRKIAKKNGLIAKREASQSGEAKS